MREYIDLIIFRVFVVVQPSAVGDIGVCEVEFNHIRGFEIFEGYHNSVSIEFDIFHSIAVNHKV